MRVISGYARGRRLKAPPSHMRSIRPTTDRVRESLFSLLGDVSGTVILDAFAGSGALGCEALSRGASFCFFCDPSSHAQRLIAHNIDVLHAVDRALSLALPLAKALSRIDLAPDIVFLDPPYARCDLLNGALQALSTCDKITASALLVVEQDIGAPPARHEAFLFDEERLYGRTRLSFLYRA